MSDTQPPKSDRTSLVIRWVGIAIAAAQATAQIGFGAPERPILFGFAASMMLGSLGLEAYRSGK